MKRVFYPCSEFAARLFSVFSTTCAYVIMYHAPHPSSNKFKITFLYTRGPPLSFSGQHMQKRDARYCRNVHACISIDLPSKEERKLKIRSTFKRQLHMYNCSHVAVMLQLSPDYRNCTTTGTHQQIFQLITQHLLDQLQCPISSRAPMQGTSMYHLHSEMVHGVHVDMWRGEVCPRV